MQPARLERRKGPEGPRYESTEPRGARRKRETRMRLLQAAFELMAERGSEGVAISEITERADVGFGSFYNHFDSKEAIFAALVDGVFEAFGAALDRIAEGVSDPAEVLAASVRYTLRRAQSEPTWGRLLVRVGFSPLALSRGLGHRLRRDLETGIASGRFVTEDQPMTFIAVGSTVLGALSAQLPRDATDAHPSQKRSKPAMKGVPERAATLVLRILGLSQRQAESIAHKPLPPIELPPGPGWG